MCVNPGGGKEEGGVGEDTCRFARQNLPHHLKHIQNTGLNWEYLAPSMDPEGQEFKVFPLHTPRFPYPKSQGPIPLNHALTLAEHSS